MNNVFTTGATTSTALLFKQGVTLTLTGNTFGTFGQAQTIYLTIQPPFLVGYEGLMRFTIDATRVRQITSGVPIQVGPLSGSIGGNGLPINCIYLTSGGNLFHDVNCNGALDPGEGIIDSTSNSYSWGSALWAADGTSGSGACQNRNLVCVDAYRAAGGASVGCTSTTGKRTIYCQ